MVHGRIRELCVAWLRTNNGVSSVSRKVVRDLHEVQRRRTSADAAIGGTIRSSAQPTRGSLPTRACRWCCPRSPAGAGVDRVHGHVAARVTSLRASTSFRDARRRWIQIQTYAHQQGLCTPNGSGFAVWARRAVHGHQSDAHAVVEHALDNHLGSFYG